MEGGDALHQIFIKALEMIAAGLLKFSVKELLKFKEEGNETIQNIINTLENATKKIT